jgi:hypothetical protein
MATFTSGVRTGSIADTRQRRNHCADARLVGACGGPDDHVGELSIRSVEFRSWWSKHSVERRTTGTKAYHHPLVGELTVNYQALNPSGDLELGSADEHEGDRHSEPSTRSGR